MYSIALAIAKAIHILQMLYICKMYSSLPKRREINKEKRKVSLRLRHQQAADGNSLAQDLQSSYSLVHIKGLKIPCSLRIHHPDG